MIEIPEALTLASQIKQTITGKQIVNVVAGQTPHKFAWYYGEPQKYHDMLVGKTINMAAAFGGRDTEKNLYGDYGGYKTMMSKNNVGSPCISCDGAIKKETYLGGSIYYCENCQLL